MILYQYPSNSSSAGGPVEFVLNGVDTKVTQDTVTPANNKPLPSALFISKEGVVRPVADSTTPANVVAVPVKIMAVDGTNINITAGDINIQTTDMGASFDSMRVGDGTGNYIGVTASDEAKTNDAAAITAIGLLAKLTDTQPVSVASLPLPSGSATSALQTTGNSSLSSIDGKFTTLNAKTAAGLVTTAHDEIVTTYVGATTKINTVVYKLATVTVATLTLSYDGSDRLIGVVRT